MSLYVHIGASLDTFFAEIVEPVASRVFARSSFEYGHDAEALGVEASVSVVIVLQPALAVLARTPVSVPELPPQALTSSAAVSTTAASSSDVGTYPVSVGAGTLSAADYDFPTLASGTLTIGPADVP